MFFNPIAVAIDRNDIAEADRLALAVKEHVGCLKIGMEFFYTQGWRGYERMARHGLPIFLDLKLHDVPATVAQTLKSLMQLEPRPSLIDVHASGGQEMLRAAVASVSGQTKLIAVTTLTSLTDKDLAAMGLGSAIDYSLVLARLARESGADGVVCSPLEVALIKKELGRDFIAVVPGVRPAGSVAGDQKRIATPREAVAAGADLLVIGRPITQADDPEAAARAIAGELVNAG
jgi:orotidine-5'-phosphate decarboxylase